MPCYGCCIGFFIILHPFRIVELNKMKTERKANTMNKTFYITGYTEIIEKLKERANSEQARARINDLKPELSESKLRKKIRDTSQARQLLDKVGTPPIPAMDGIERDIDKAVRGELLSAEEIEKIGRFLAAVSRMKSYLERGRVLEISLAYYCENLEVLEELRLQIEQAVRGGEVEDSASSLLRQLRRDLVTAEEKVKQKAESILRSQKKYMAESFVVTRNGKVCLPVKKEYKGKIPGSVEDKSATGATVFIEPEQIAALREKVEILQIDEENEVRRILYTLVDLIAEQEEVFQRDLETLVKLDFVFAKGKLSADMNAMEPGINTQGYLILCKAKNPLLNQEECVPLDLKLGGSQRGIIITGPNTGGKTVAIKTAGLFTLMALSGLHVPCQEADICMRNQVLCDIGDGQSITDNLSTFSAHICNVLDILREVTSESLVILDELGSGTDPAEGMGIAVAILEELRNSGCIFLATTHYPEVKNYAGEHEEILNARMAFDRENLKPLYRLEVGKSGESCALYIAKRLGMPAGMLRVASQKAYGEEKEIPEELEQNAEEELQRRKSPSIIKEKKMQLRKETGLFVRGDSVTVLPEKKIGIVVNPPDDRGNVLVQIHGEKVEVNYKRLKLKASAADLYPEDYDFSIIFDTVENRKARHKMEKSYRPDLEVHYDR